MLAGTDKTIVKFDEDKYISETDIGKTEFGYGSIAMIAENKDYFAFIFDYTNTLTKNKRFQF